MSKRRLNVQDAAEALGISVDAVRMRARRGSLDSEHEDGRLYVWVNVDETTDETDVRDALIEELRDRIRYLEEESRRKDHLLGRCPGAHPSRYRAALRAARILRDGRGDLRYGYTTGDGAAPLVAKVVRRMTQDPTFVVLLIIANLVTGLISGGVAGAFVAYRLRKRGNLLCQVDHWKDSGKSGGVIDSRTFTLKILNEKDVGTALWNMRVVFYKNGKRLFSKDTTNTAKTPIDVLDLPPQVTVTQVFYIPFHATDANLAKAKASDALRFVADVPGEGEGAFEQELPPWEGPGDKPPS